VGGGGAIPPGVGTPLQGAAAVFDRLLPGAPAPGAPSTALATPWEMIPTIPLPHIPGLPVPLPKEIKMPSDGICAGTAGLWSASAGTGAQPGATPAATAGTDRRDW
jgi:hypothetical protein